MEQNLKNISNILKNTTYQEMKPKFTAILTMDKKRRTIIRRRQQCLRLRYKPLISFVVFSYSEWKSRLMYFLICSRFSAHSWLVLLMFPVLWCARQFPSLSERDSRNLSPTLFIHINSWPADPSKHTLFLPSAQTLFLAHC